jgi:hypothetical protein
MLMKSPGSQMVGVFLLALISMASSVSLLQRAEHIRPGGMGKDEITLYLRRFEPLRKALPARATVGYEADSEDPLTDRQEVKRFYLTQYALAPVIVAAGVDRDLVIANYRDPSSCRICRSRNFILVNDFGQGLMLFRRSAR